MTKNRTIAVDRTAPAHRLYLRHLRGHPHLTIGPESDRSQSDRDTLAPNAAIASQSVRLCAQEKKIRTNLYEYALGGSRTHEIDLQV